MKTDVKILGIETSCDETSAAVVKNGRQILSNIISSQAKVHERYGGVVPEIASRKHMEHISQVVDMALDEAGCTLKDIDAIAVTNGPGLVGALLVGVSYAKGLSYGAKKPLIGVHHLESHVCSSFLENEHIKPPFISLLVSGGHTSLIYVKDYGKYVSLGATKDDAVGEAYDKVARVIGLGYPGGPKVDALAKEGDPLAINFPRVMINEPNLDFSFSGLKSSVINYLNKANMKNEEVIKADVAASFQQAAVDVLVTKTIKACKAENVNLITLAGGVACNSKLREEISKKAVLENINYHLPKPILCTDNAAMVAACGFLYYNKKISDLDLNAYPDLSIVQ